MPGAFYKLFGYALWKGGIWYVRRHSPRVSRWIGAGALLTAAVGCGALVALRRNGHAS